MHADESDYIRHGSLALLDDLDGLPEDEVIPDWVIAADDMLHYIPMELHTKMNPAFYRGFALVFDAMAQVLSRDATDPRCIPTPAAIAARLRELSVSRDVPSTPTAATGALPTPPPSPGSAMSELDAQDVERFFAAGGKPEFALEALTDRAMEKSPEGTEYRRRRMWQEDEALFQDEVSALPACDNDLDFELVRFKLGLQPTGIGPHWFFLTDSSDEGEDEDDEDDETFQDVITGAALKRRA